MYTYVGTVLQEDHQVWPIPGNTQQRQNILVFQFSVWRKMEGGKEGRKDGEKEGGREGGREPTDRDVIE